MGRSVSCFTVLAFLLMSATRADAQPLSTQAEESIAAPGAQGEAGETEQSPQPPPELERPSRWGEPTEVEIGIYVIDVDGVDSANQNFSASIYYEARWNNSLLRHDGPGPQIRGTTEVWTPRLTIVNQQQAWNAYPSYVEISPDGQVVLRQKTWGWFSQPLDLRDFPLDRQVLQIRMAAAGLSASDVKMVPRRVDPERRAGIASEFSFPDFDVVSWEARPEQYVPFEGLAGVPGFVMEIEIQREAAYYIWKLILPLCLIVAMSWVPRWISRKEVGTSIGISTTSFLTLVAYLFAVAVLLPRVAYLTRIDLFILMATLMVFASLVQTVMMASLVVHLTDRQTSIMNAWSRILYPLALVAVLGISFG